MRRSAAVLGIFVLSGAAGLIYEIVWSRQLVLVFGNTTQAISAILTGFFGGMAIGAFAGGRIADRVRSPLRMYGFLEIALAVLALGPATVMMGATFPALVRHFATSAALSQAFGRLYSANTVGAVIGTL